ncbi:MAG: sigma-54-dependent Fis family transcriptional regulator [Deltaproteobacteria bacterium]|nr:sigma-54-dependent Fis family transcriptional regulator [Deltaproteobacteria bacterium]MBN2671919.1 sigma-54-dependent Fis family transcriptional regulator [Deltaproteobacteria bacterium]
MSERVRLLLIDDGDTYADLIQTRMPEFELVAPPGPSPWLKDGPSAIGFLADNTASIDAVLLDMHFDIPEERLFPLDDSSSLRRTKRFQGVAILREIHERFPSLPVVLLTSLEDLSLVDAATDLVSQSMTYVLDSNDVDALRVRIHSATQSNRTDGDTRILWGEDAQMKAIHRRLTVLAKGGMPIILEGETGTGKSYLAEQFVHLRSERSGPFVVLDLSTVPSNLVSSHLFGAVKGAYTGAVETRKGVFEMANGGTLFIDEIQNAPLEIQKQLLLVLQDRKVRPLGATREIHVDVKVVAASNRPLDEAVAAGTFRPDLYMRLSPATRVHIPPLRKRIGDLAFLAKRFTERAFYREDIAALCAEVAPALGVSVIRGLQLVVGRERHDDEKDTLLLVVPKPVWKMLESHHWPGNIRELEMLIYNLITFTLVDAIDAVRRNISLSSNQLQVDTGLVGNLLQGAMAVPLSSSEEFSAGLRAPNQLPVTVHPGATLNEVAKEVERQYFLSLFKRCKRDFSEMALMLLGDETKARSVRLRFNQLGLKVREIE